MGWVNRLEKWPFFGWIPSKNLIWIIVEIWFNPKPLLTTEEILTKILTIFYNVVSSRHFHENWICGLIWMCRGSYFSFWVFFGGWNWSEIGRNWTKIGLKSVTNWSKLIQNWSQIGRKMVENWSKIGRNLVETWSKIGQK